MVLSIGDFEHTYLNYRYEATRLTFTSGSYQKLDELRAVCIRSIDSAISVDILEQDSTRIHSYPKPTVNFTGLSVANCNDGQYRNLRLFIAVATSKCGRALPRLATSLATLI
jgi:hypothetical protein